MRKSMLLAAALIAALGVASLTGCERVFTGEPHPNLPPEVWLSSGPVQGDTTGYQVHFYWSGWDPDGEIAFYEFCLVESTDHGFGFNPADTTGLDKWTRTAAHDSIFRVPADGNPRPWPKNDEYTIYDKSHTFFIRAVDRQGMRTPDSLVAHRSFTAWTLAPYIIIDAPPEKLSYSSVITFRWTGRDPIDSEANLQDPEAIRYLNIRNDRPDGTYDRFFNVVEHMNSNPEHYERFWSRWIPYRAEGDSGRVTTIRVNQLGVTYVFALQARSEAGAVTAVFDRKKNARVYGASAFLGPELTVKEPLLGNFYFRGERANYIQQDLPPGVWLNFSWSADAEDYGGEIRSFRYGWNIVNLERPDEWEGPSIFLTRAAPERFDVGTHRLLIEVVDNGRRITYGKIEVNIVPFTMERPLLWVDDWALGGHVANMMVPSEAAHDAFWVGICSRAEGFRPERDVYDVAAANAQQPAIGLIGQYANIIWTYSNSDHTGWKKVVEFTPESMARGAVPALNYLGLFMAQGGRLLTCGRPDKSGALYEAFITTPRVPASFKFESAILQSDTSGVNSMPYRDYCVSVVDKVDPAGFKSVPGWTRDTAYDRMLYLYKASQGEIAKYPDFPGQLRLGSHVLTGCPSPGCYFRNYDQPGGNPFIFLEVYDPKYYMDDRGVRSRSCFNPIYRMHTPSTRSPFHQQVVALIVTRYRELFETDIERGEDYPFTPANSFHFGFPLWYFDHQDIHAIMGAIFADWGILEE